MIVDPCDMPGFREPKDPYTYKFFCEFDSDTPIPSRITPFSGWLARDGRFFICGYASHGLLARRLVKQEWPGNEYASMTEAEQWLNDRGWHRVDPEGTITTGYGANADNMSEEQMSTIRQLAVLSEPGSEFERAMLDYIELNESVGTRRA